MAFFLEPNNLLSELELSLLIELAGICSFHAGIIPQTKQNLNIYSPRQYVDPNETYGPPECATVGKVKEEDLKIGDVSVETIKYYFFDDKLARIGLWGSYKDFDRIKTALILKYGKYDQVPYNNSYDWKIGNVKISLIWWFQETYIVVYEYLPLKKKYDICKENLDKARRQRLKEEIMERHKKIMGGL